MKPLTRKEFFMAKAAGQTVPDIEPITREEYFLNQIAENGGGGGGGGGCELTFVEYEASEDGQYEYLKMNSEDLFEACLKGVVHASFSADGNQITTVWTIHTAWYEPDDDLYHFYMILETDTVEFLAYTGSYPTHQLY